MGKEIGKNWERSGRIGKSCKGSVFFSFFWKIEKS